MATAKKTTAKKMTLVQKMIQVSKNIGFIGFDKVNPHQGWGYASAAGMIRKFNEEFSDLGILCTVETSEVESSDGKMFTCRLCLAFRDADSDACVLSWGEAGAKNGDKAPQAASTGAFKQALAHAFMLSWGAEDPEADGQPPVPKAQAAPADKTLVADIQKAKNEKELTALRNRVSVLAKGSKARNEAVAAYKTKEEELK